MDAVPLCVGLQDCKGDPALLVSEAAPKAPLAEAIGTKIAKDGNLLLLHLHVPVRLQA